MKKVTQAQLIRAFRTAPREVERAGKVFLQRGISEYRRVAMQSSPWRVGQRGGGIPVDTGNLRERHRTRVRGLTATFGVSDQGVPYAKYVHGDSGRPQKVRGRNIKTRPWLAYARDKGDRQVTQHYKVFMDEILAHIAT